MESTGTSSLFTSLQNLQKYLKLHKKYLKDFFSNIPMDCLQSSFDYYTVTDLLNNILLLKENIIVLITSNSENPPFYLKLNGLIEEKKLLQEISDLIQYKMKEDFKDFLKSMKKYPLTGVLDKVDLFLNPIFQKNLDECLKDVNSFIEEIQQILIESGEELIKKKKKMNEIYLKKTYDKLKYYNMMLDFWVNEEPHEKHTLLHDCQNFLREFMRLYKKMESDGIKISILRKDLKKFFKFNIKNENMSLKEIDLDFDSNLINGSRRTNISCQHIEITEMSNFYKLKHVEIKDANLAEAQNMNKILSKNGCADKIIPFLDKMANNNEEIIKMVVFSCNLIFEDLSTSFFAKFNALHMIKKGMDLSVPLFIRFVDNSLIRNLALLVYLSFTKEILIEANEENLHEQFTELGKECFFVWGKIYNKTKEYPNFSLAFKILLEKNVEFPTSFKFFERKDAMSSEQQLLHKIMREKTLMKEFLENNLDNTELSVFVTYLKNIDNLIDNSEVYSNFETLQEKDFIKSIKKELEDFHKSKINFINFRNNALKLIIKNKYQQESFTISARLTPALKINLVEEKKNKKIPSFSELLNENDEKIPRKFKNNSLTTIYQTKSNTLTPVNKTISNDTTPIINHKKEEINSENEKIIKEKAALVKKISEFSKKK